MISYKELHKQLMYNPWTGYFYRKISNSNRIKIGEIAGSKTPKGYIQLSINNKRYLAHRLAWFYVHGYMPENDIDHEDRIRHHNWINNLRETSQQCNSRNCGNPKNNTSSVKGVSWNKQNQKWLSKIRINYQTKYLGKYSDFDEAVCARLAGEQCVGWEGCDSNSPAYQYVTENIKIIIKGE